MSFASEFPYLWKQLEDGVYASLRKRLDEGQAVSAADANQAVRTEISKWADTMRPQHSFLLQLGKADPSLEKAFIDCMNSFVFRPEREPAAPSAVPYVLLWLVCAAAGAGLGYLVSGFSFAAKYLGTTLSVVGGGVIFAALFAGVLRSMWKSKAQMGRRAVLDGYMKQLEKLNKDLSALCGRADKR